MKVPQEIPARPFQKLGVSIRNWQEQHEPTSEVISEIKRCLLGGAGYYGIQCIIGGGGEIFNESKIIHFHFAAGVHLPRRLQTAIDLFQNRSPGDAVSRNEVTVPALVQRKELGTVCLQTPEPLRVPESGRTINAFVETENGARLGQEMQ